MAKKYICALDIGNSKITALIGKIEHNQFQLVGIGESASQGLKEGMVINIDTTTQAIQAALSQAENMAGCKITSITTGISGNHICARNVHAEVNIRDGEVTQSDIERAKEIAMGIVIPSENQVLHTVIQEYIIDGQEGIQQPVGICGTRLNINMHIITGKHSAERNIRRCIESPCHLDINEIKIQALASSEAVLEQDEKELGVCVLDIGHGTTDIAVYHHGAIRHTAVLPFAGYDITTDLQTVLTTSFQAAEEIKIRYGSALTELTSPEQMIEVPSLGKQAPRKITHTNLAQIIQARLEQIFDIVKNELATVDIPLETLNSGIVITGGTAHLQGISELAHQFFDLPVRIGTPKNLLGMNEGISTPPYASAIGLLLSASDYAQQTGTNSGKENTQQTIINHLAHINEPTLALPTQTTNKLSLWKRFINWWNDTL